MKTLIQKLLNKKLITQLLKFGTVGVFNTLVDFGIFYALTEIYKHTALYAPESQANTIFAMAAQTVSYLLAVLGSYLLNKYWTFQAGKQKKGAAIVKMYALSIVCFCLLQAMLWFWIDVAGIESEMLAKLFATVPITVLNFAGSKLWVFRDKKESKPCA